MFRYFGFHWQADLPAQAAVAGQIEAAVLHAPAWALALSRPGLRVFTTGHRAGVNSAHTLSTDRGVILGRLFRREEASPPLKNFSLSAKEAQRIVETEGQALVDQYWGRYVAILETASRGACVLRDPSGALPCHRLDVEGVAIFFSWLEDLIAFTPRRPVPRVSREAMAMLVGVGHLGGRATALEGMTQFLPGRLTPLDPDAPPEKRLWNALAIARTSSELAPLDAEAELRRVVMDCVHAWSSCYDSILLRLSGGVDSSIVLGSLSARPVSTRITCLNYHSAGADSDERRYARLAAAQAEVELIEMAQDASYPLRNILTGSRMPAPESYIGRMDTSRLDAEVAAARDASAMFTGHGGDQLFFQQRCTWPAADYLHAHGFDRGFVEACMDAARLARVSFWQAMRSAFVDQRRREPRSDGIGQFFKLACPGAFDAVRRQRDHYVHPDMSLASDLPIGKFDHFQGLIEPPGYYDLFRPEAAPEIVTPLRSQPVLELCLALPTWLLTRGGRGRALARRAFRNHIPREIALRQSKGGMEEIVRDILRRNLPLARGLLLDGYLVREGLIQRDKVEAVLADRLSGTAAYLGEIHHYLALEAWLRRFPESSLC